MFIDYFMTICDQILRRAAEENPGSMCLQSIPLDNNDDKSQILKESPKGTKLKHGA